MKKIGLLIACVVVACSAFAQVGTFSYGVKAAFNLSNFYGDDVNGNKILPGYQVGVVGEYRVSNLFGIAPELMFSAQGAKFDIKGEKNTMHMNYINLPIMAKFHIWNGLSLNVGPEFGLCVFNHLGGVKVDSDLYNKFNLGIGAGASYSFGKLFVDARYTQGLTHVVKDSSVRNYNIQIGLGYMF